MQWPSLSDCEDAAAANNCRAGNRRNTHVSNPSLQTGSTRSSENENLCSETLAQMAREVSKFGSLRRVLWRNGLLSPGHVGDST
jgi:hypothetical protein